MSKKKLEERGGIENDDLFSLQASLHCITVFNAVSLAIYVDLTLILGGCNAFLPINMQNVILHMAISPTGEHWALLVWIYIMQLL